MSPQRPRSYPYPEDEFSRIDMTVAEGKAIRDGNNERQAAWERRQAIVSHPAFHMGQDDPLHNPVWGEEGRGSMRPIEHGPDLFQDLVTGATEVATGVVDTYRDMAVQAWRGWGEIADRVATEVRAAATEEIRSRCANAIAQTERDRALRRAAS